MAESKINFFKEGISFRLNNQADLTSWISRAIRNEGFRAGEINIIFCTDPFLRRINKQHLGHDYETDIVTFESGDDPSMINGELYISIDRVRDNATAYGCSFRDELHRVIIHGILHLCNYSDKSKSKQREMRGREDYYLSKRSWT